MSMVVKFVDRRRKAEEEMWDVARPQCSRCGELTRFVAVVDHPIHGRPDQRMVQFACSDCRELFEEVVTLPKGYERDSSRR